MVCLLSAVISFLPYLSRFITQLPPQPRAAESGAQPVALHDSCTSLLLQQQAPSFLPSACPKLRACVPVCVQRCVQALPYIAPPNVPGLWEADCCFQPVKPESTQRLESSSWASAPERSTLFLAVPSKMSLRKESWVTPHPAQQSHRGLDSKRVISKRCLQQERRRSLSLHL